MTLLGSLCISFLVALGGSVWLGWRRYAVWQDQPGVRSLHDLPVPRSGGLAIWAGVLAGAVFGNSLWQALFDPYLLLAVLLLGAVAVWDDVRSLPAWIRLLIQLMAALLAVMGAGLFLHTNDLPFLWAGISVLMFLWGINLYNFMDGMDGFAGGMAVFGFGGLAIVGGMHGDMAYAGLCGLIVTASLGFLWPNFPPAKLFMGDSGSTVMGFAMVSMGILGWQRGNYPFWTPLLLFSPFWLDATLTLLKRLWRREKIWQAHRQHYYQRWVLAGFSHRQVVLGEYGFMTFCLALVLAWQNGFAGYNESVLLSLWALVCGAGILVSEKYLARRND